MKQEQTKTYHISPAIVRALVQRWDRDGRRSPMVTDWAVEVNESGRVVGIAAYQPINEHVLLPASNHGTIVG